MEKAVIILSSYIFLYPLLMSFVWMIGGLLFYWRHESGHRLAPALTDYPMFSVLVPCHNEENQIGDTIGQLLKLEYPNYEIIAIDDGSSDWTAKIIKSLCNEYDRVRGVYLKENRGKAGALNIGTLVSRSEFIVTLDADALLSPDALYWMAWHFEKYPRVGAVTGNPRVINRSSLLGRIQIGEYATIIGLIKRTQRVIGKVLTVSGVIAAFRKTALHRSGYWDSRMVTEDIDITWELEKRFWDVRYEPRATCWIYVPETIWGLFKQRMRWAQGSVEVFKKHQGIWGHWRQRRLWPVYLEGCVSVLWAYCFWGMVGLWFINFLIMLPAGTVPSPPLPPNWTGSVLASACILQFLVSFFIDRRYEKKMFRYLFWVIWYPFAYWMINSFMLLFAAPRALFKKTGQPALWQSPDRGLAKLAQKETDL